MFLLQLDIPKPFIKNMKISQELKGGKKIALAKPLAILLLVMLLTSGVFAVSNIDFAEYSDNNSTETSYSPANSTLTKTQSESKNHTETKVSETLPKNNISISLSPRKQTSANGEATYNIIVKSLFLPDSDSLRASEYQLYFEPEDQNLKGKFSTEKFTLQPNGKITVELNIYAENSGEHKFAVRVVNENGNEAKSEGLLSVLDSNTASHKIKLDLQPEKQYTENGTSEYVLTVYRPFETPCYNNIECTSVYPAQEYELVLVSEQGRLGGEFKGSNLVSVSSGEKKSLALKITAKEKGTYVFKVYAKEPQEPQPASESYSYLKGEGFATNEDKSEGVLVAMHLLGDDEETRGKMTFNKDSYALKGEVSDSGTQINLSIFNPEDPGFGQSVGEFNGEIRRFNNFMVLHGGLVFKNNDYPNQYWALTITGKQNSVFENEIVVAQPDTPVTKTINKEEVVTIRQGRPKESEILSESESKETYIVPEKIERKKLLGIFPNPWGDKLLKVKLVDGDTITEKTVKEFSTTTVGNYDVTIGSLENEDAIDVSVTKTTQTEN